MIAARNKPGGDARFIFDFVLKPSKIKNRSNVNCPTL